jgi:hypothetical protein
VRWEGIWPALQSSRVRDQPTNQPGEQPIAIARTRWPRASRNRLIQHSSSRAYVWTCGGGIKIALRAGRRRPRKTPVVDAAAPAPCLPLSARRHCTYEVGVPRERRARTQISRAGIAQTLGPRAALPRDPCTVRRHRLLLRARGETRRELRVSGRSAAQAHPTGRGKRRWSPSSCTAAT